MMNATYVLEEMRAGAKLHRDAGNVELRRMDGAVVHVPLAVFDDMIDADHIVPAKAGFYRLTRSS